MEYRQLGRFGVRVSPLCLGAMNFGSRTTETDAVRMIHAAIDGGINFIDTANGYGGGRSEEIVGEALKNGRRDGVVLATKVFSPIGRGTNDWGTSRFAVMREVDRSLRRLQTDRIDLYQLHRHDGATPLEETLGALDDLVRAGKVRYIGVSTFPAWVLAKAQGIAARMQLQPIATEQPPYNLLEREVERELIPACVDFGMGVIPWSPLAGGMLSERFVGGSVPKDARAVRVLGDQPMPDVLSTAIDKLAALAAENGTTLSRFALAWLRDMPGVTAPIMGPSRMDQLDDAIASLGVTVGADARRAVDEIVPPRESLWMRVRERIARERARQPQETRAARPKRARRTTAAPRAAAKPKSTGRGPGRKR